MCQLRGELNRLRNGEKAIPGRLLRRIHQRKIRKLIRSWWRGWEIESGSRHKRKTTFFGRKYSGSFTV
jgi:hypothetical protein